MINKANKFRWSSSRRIVSRDPAAFTSKPLDPGLRISGVTTLVAFCLLTFALPLAVAAPTASTPGGGKSVTPEEMEAQIKGQFKGRLLINKIVAPVTMNL